MRLSLPASFHRLLARLGALAMIPAMVTTLLAAGSGLWTIAAIEHDRQAAELAAAGRRLDQALAEIGARMQAYAASQVTRPDIVAALGAGDSAAATRLLAETFTAIRTADPSISVLEA